MITVIFEYQTCGFNKYKYKNDKSKTFKNEDSLFQYIDSYNKSPMLIPYRAKRIIDFKIV